MREHTSLFIGGEWRAPSTDRTLEVVAPHTETVIARLAAPDAPDVDLAVATAREAFDHGPWRGFAAEERIGIVRDLADRYAEREDELARLITA
ncbi:aldehyde dehydrogenase family protein, partial [Nocardia sp. NPDC019302]|uniref:aldehyde dehydrogenase family protein n=1 Tax=Nocardia sp. NPDC019302 TaxID=3154592 RepID=UPI0033E8BC86